MDTGHPATVLPIVEQYQKQLNADLLLVTGKQGRMLAELVTPDVGPSASFAAMPGVAAAAAGQETSFFWPQNNGVLQVVSVPIWIDSGQPEILGTLSVGFSLDARAAARFQLLTNSDIAFGMDGAIRASTLPAGAWPQLSPLLSRDGLSERVGVADQEYIAITRELSQGIPVATTAPAPPPPSTGRAHAIILRSRTERLSFLNPLHRQLAVIAVVAVLAATLLSYAIARTVTRPLGAITATMREMAATGDLTRRIPPSAEAMLGGRRRAAAGDDVQHHDRFDRRASSARRRSASGCSSLGRLSTVVAHEIRNPLMIIKTALRPLRGPSPTPEQVRAAAADIDEEISRLNRIVSEVLDFARPIKFELAPADLNALCEDAARAAGCRRRTRCPSGSISIPGCRIGRHRRRAPAAGAREHPHQRPARRRGQGRGPHRPGSDPPAHPPADRQPGDDRGHATRARALQPEDLARVFDPYFTTRRTGTGLGLAISRNIVEGLGGTISIASRNGCRAPRSGSSFPTGTRLASMTAGSILLVDDETKILNALAQALRGEGHEVVATANPREAQRLLAQRMFDVLVIDNLMPDLTGLDLIRELHAGNAAERPQIVMMTAHATVESAIEAMKLGAFDYLQKPFEIDELLVVVNRALDHQRLRTQHRYLISERDAEFNHYGIVGRSRRDAGGDPHRGAGGAVEEHRAHHRRDRHRQGDGGARDPLPQRAARDAADQGELRRDPRNAARIGAVRPRPRRLHRRDDEQEGQVRARRRRHDLPRRDRHDEPGAAGEAAARAAGARVRAARIRAHAEGRRSASSPRPTATCARWSPTAGSRRICTTAST